jgi:long-chain fatty acid transport protein
MLLRVVSVFFLFLICSVLTNIANALELNRQVQNLDFRFNNPGARANGMGGAFIAAADDATAAYSNPAGLTILKNPEIAVEAKLTKYKSSVYSLAFDDDLGESRIVEVENDNRVANISFLSLVYPGKDAVFSLFRHELASTDTDSEFIGIIGRTSTKANQQMSIVTLGFSAGFKVNNRLSLGAGISFSELNIMNTFVYDSRAVPPGPANDPSDSATHGTVGVLWNPTEKLSFGATYKYGPEFNYKVTSVVRGQPNFKDKMKVPDIYSFGIAYRPTPSLLMLSDINYILWSQLGKNLGTTFQHYYSDGVAGHPLTLIYDETQNFAIDDGLDIRAGFEYVMPISGMPFAIRSGYHYSPQHSIYYKRDMAFEDHYGSYFQSFNNHIYYPKKKDEHIIAFGFGFVPKSNLQFDFSGSWSDKSNEYTASAVYRFE